MEAFQEILAELARLAAALEAKGDGAAQTTLRQDAQVSALKIKHAVERARDFIAHEREIENHKAAARLDSALRSESLRADVAEAERKNLQASLDSLVVVSGKRVRALEEEVDALLSPLRGATARGLYEQRIRDLESELVSAKAERESHERKLTGDGVPRSEIERGRDAVMVQIALTRETEVASRLSEARARLERLRSSV